MEVGKMKFKRHKVTKDDWLVVLVGVLFGGIIALPLSLLGVTSIDDIIIPAFFIIGFITFVSGIFKWIFRL